MPAHDGHVPAMRSAMTERSSSSLSLSKGSPSAGQLSKSHKAHRAHAVGHGRPVHARVPSHGKGLNKLSKVGAVAQDAAAAVKRESTRSTSRTPPASPGNGNGNTAAHFRKTSSHVSLPRTGSKVSVKKSQSHAAISRNVSAVKLGNKSKSEKSQLKATLKKKGTNDGRLQGKASFEVGDEEEDDGEDDDEWTEDSSSPFTTRYSSANPSRPKTPIIRDPPSAADSVDDLVAAGGHEPDLGSKLPTVQAGQTPSLLSTISTAPPRDTPPRRSSLLSHLPPDAEAVSQRLLNRISRPQTPTTQTSTVSANVSPPRLGSHANHEDASSPSIKEPSMPSDGISRFLDRQDSDSTSATPGSISNLQSNLAHLTNSSNKNDSAGAKSRVAGPGSQKTSDTRRVKSAANLAHSSLLALPNGDDTPTTSRTRGANGTAVAKAKASGRPKSKDEEVRDPQQSSKSQRRQQERQKTPGPSPFESARAADPTAGKSLTQLKLDLQRMAVQRSTEPPPSLSNNPLLNQGYAGTLNLTNLVMGHNGYGGEGFASESGGGGGVSGAGGSNLLESDVRARVKRQYDSARRDLGGVRRFHPEIVRQDWIMAVGGGGGNENSTVVSGSGSGSGGNDRRRRQQHGEKLRLKMRQLQQQHQNQTHDRQRGNNSNRNTPPAAANGGLGGWTSVENANNHTPTSKSSSQKNLPTKPSPAPIKNFNTSSGTGSGRGVRFEIGSNKSASALDSGNQSGTSSVAGTTPTAANGSGAGGTGASSGIPPYVDEVAIAGLLRRMWIDGGEGYGGYGGGSDENEDEDEEDDDEDEDEDVRREEKEERMHREGRVGVVGERGRQDGVGVVGR